MQYKHQIQILPTCFLDQWNGKNNSLGHSDITVSFFTIVTMLYHCVFTALDGARKSEGIDRLGRGRLRQPNGGDALQVHTVVRRTAAWYVNNFCLRLKHFFIRETLQDMLIQISIQHKTTIKLWTGHI